VVHECLHQELSFVSGVASVRRRAPRRIRGIPDGVAGNHRALNAATGSDDLDRPAHDIGDCIPHLFDEDGLSRAVERIRLLAA
jgi:hypothetical protein